jgi:hypothetical protein
VFRRHFPIHKLFERSCELGVFRLTADVVTQIFGVRKHKRLRGKLHTMLEKLDHGHHVLRIYGKSLVARTYEKFGTFLRVEVCVNRLKDLGLNKGLEQLPALREKLIAVTDHLRASRPTSSTCMSTSRCSSASPRLSVSNSLSSGDWELDEVPAVRDPTHVMQLGWRAIRVHRQRSLRSAASTIDTKAELPDRPAPNCSTRAAPHLPGTARRQRNTPAAGAVYVATCRHAHIGAHHDPDDVRDEIGIGQLAATGTAFSPRRGMCRFGWQTDFLIRQAKPAPRSYA